VSEAERSKFVIDAVRSRIATAEVTAVRFTGLTGGESPVVCTYHVKVPDYAQATGQRLLLRPAFFQYGDRPLFDSNERTHPVQFHYAWAEADTIHMALPGPCTLEPTEPDPPLKVPNVGGYESSLTLAADKQKP